MSFANSLSEIQRLEKLPLICTSPARRLPGPFVKQRVRNNNFHKDGKTGSSYADTLAKFTLWIPLSFQESGIYFHRGIHSGLRDWRQHGHLQRRQCRTAKTFA